MTKEAAEDADKYLDRFAKKPIAKPVVKAPALTNSTSLYKTQMNKT